MLLFCPYCSNTLTVSLAAIPTSTTNPQPTGEQSNRLECRTCPYQYHIIKPLHDRRKYSPKKDVEDVFGGPAAWNDAQKTTVQCANSECDGMEAAFFQVQIRSADEPMTLFYKCMTCDHRWRD